MIFPYLECESKLQVLDKTRISATKSYTTKDESKITLIEIEADSGQGFFAVGSYPLVSDIPKPQDWFLDWQYLTAGTKTVSVRITTNGAPVVSTFQIDCMDEATDALWSSDHDLRAHEPDILKWVEPGRNSFKNIHRKAQIHVLEYLDASRIWRTDGTRLEKQDIRVTTDVKELSTYLALYFIFRGIQNKPDDIFGIKARDYESMVTQTKQRGRIQADMNQDAVIDKSESQDLRSFRLVRG